MIPYNARCKLYASGTLISKLPDLAADAQAAEDFMVWQFAWMGDVLKTGDYPAVMRLRMGGSLPAFTPEQQKALKGSWDFFALNYYTSHYVSAGGQYVSV